MPSSAPQTFTITLQPSGNSFSCAPSLDILKAGLASGVSLRYSCRSGVCRTCRAKLIKGEVDPGVVHPNYLSEADRAAGYVHLCCTKPLSDCVVEAIEIQAGQIPVKQAPVRVVQMERLAPDVMQVTLSFPPNDPQKFSAGQYLLVQLQGGLTRSYSMASAPTAEGIRQVELHVRHMPGGLFTDRVFSTLKVRDLLRVETPHGFFCLDESSTKPMVMLASGTGFAPIKAMVEYSLQRGMTRAIHLYWGGRKREDIYMDELVSSWTTQHPHITYIPVLSNASGACEWSGRQGFVHSAVMQDLPDLSGHQVYACGAPLMVDAARRDFVAQCQLPDDQFFADSFVTEADKARDSTPAMSAKPTATA